MSEPRGAPRPALLELSRTRMLAFIREPEAIFWVFAFPILLALALGIAFRNQGTPRSEVVIAAGTGDGALRRALERSPDLSVSILAPVDADAALRRGKAQVVVRPGDPPTLIYDPSRPETRLAQLTVKDALERAAGREDRLSLRSDTRMRPGSRYIDFLIPGLIGLNLLGTGMWGVGFPIANARQLKLLKRMVATPMRRSDYLLSLMVARLVFLALEVIAIVVFGWLAFGVLQRGSWPGFVAVSLLGAFAFSALGLLVACRARTIEAVSGLMNVVMMPMWLLSGSFFSADRFPAFLQPFIRALPLTAANDAYRALMNEGATFAQVSPQLGVLLAWTVVSFALALAWFRWD
ncbi:MAG TPA: ABC transporter permease [Candidatus Eisenbacteria bacterium]|nr:ABC transporter permease [Candidatus Eisenbacteria bacterium]